jgi:L-asparagine oxygenase
MTTENHRNNLNNSIGRKPLDYGINIRPSAGGAGEVAEILARPEEVRLLRRRIQDIARLPNYDDCPDLYEQQCAAWLKSAAPKLVRDLQVIAKLTRRPALVVIYGPQVDKRPVATPLDGVFVQANALAESAVLAGCMRHLGLSGIAFASENDGRLARAVCPVEAHSNTASSQGADAELHIHTDNGHYVIIHSNDAHPFRLPVANPYQYFATITPVETTPMRVKLLDDVLARLDKGGGDYRQIPAFDDLQRPEFRYTSPPSHGAVVHGIEPLPALVKLDGEYASYGVRFHGRTMEGVTPRARAALELFKDAIDRTPEEVIHTLRGDIIGYENRRALHRREPFNAKFDGTDRFYLRVYGCPTLDVELMRALLGRNGRVM